MANSITIVLGAVGGIGIFIAIGMIAVGCVLDFSATNRQLAKSLMGTGAAIALASIAGLGIVAAVVRNGGMTLPNVVAILVLVAATIAFDRIFRRRPPPDKQ